jgi:hypothetical protein
VGKVAQVGIYEARQGVELPQSLLATLEHREPRLQRVPLPGDPVELLPEPVD